jgi:hypothetical protein
MPERKYFRGREIKHARPITLNKKTAIRITFVGPKGKRGEQLIVSQCEYDTEVVRDFVPGRTTINA